MGVLWKQDADKENSFTQKKQEKKSARISPLDI